MSVDYFPGMQIQKSPLQYMNDTIIREVKSLVKQEKFVLETENDQLKRNNDELVNRIHDLYNEFDISTRVYREKYTDEVDHTRHLEKKAKRAHRKKLDLLKDKYDQSSTLSDLKSQLEASQDRLSLMKMQNRESDSEFQITNKKVEILEEQNRALKAKIREMENSNKDLRHKHRTMSKPMNNPRETSIDRKKHRNMGFSVTLEDTSIDRKKHRNMGFSVTLEDNDDSHSIVLKAEQTSNRMASPTISSNYLEVFDNKEMADAYFGDRQPESKNTGEKKFFQNSYSHDIQNGGDHMMHSPRSPIYVDIKSSRKHKYTSTDALLDHSSILEIGKKQALSANMELRMPQDVNEEIAKLSDTNRLLCDKLDLISSNIINPLTRAESKDPLLKRTSEDIMKISEEQQQIINMLEKNSKLLQQLQQSNENGIHSTVGSLKENAFSMTNKRHDTKIKKLNNLSCQTEMILLGDDIEVTKKSPKMLEHMQQTNENIVPNGSGSSKENAFSTSNKKHDSKIRNLNNLSCQTELILLGDDIEVTKKVDKSRIPNEKDVFQLINDQDSKIRDLSDRLSLMQRDRQGPRHTTNERSSTKNGVKATFLSETSFEDISTLTDLMKSTSDKESGTLFPVVDNSKSLSSTDIQHSPHIQLDVNSSQTMPFDVTNNAPIGTQSDELISSEFEVKQTVQTTQAGPGTVIATKGASKIPKLITSRSLEIIERKVFERDSRVYSNDLESSYETLYDPMSSARFDRENLISI